MTADGCRPSQRRARRMVSHQMIAFAIAGMLILALGCSRDYSGVVAGMNSSNIRRLSNLYRDFQESRTGIGPKSEAELRQHIQTKPLATFQVMGIDPNNRDRIWISERDHKPFKLRYGVDSPLGAVAAVVFEQEGVAGKREVGFNNFTVEEVDDARYNALWEGRGVARQGPIGGPPGSAEAGKSK
jgi:hypothetical protein